MKHEGLALSLSELLSRPYFWIVWVLQEIALAKKAVMICGGTSISWNLFTRRRMVSSCPNLLPAHLPSTFQAAGSSNITALPPAVGFKKPAVRDIADILPLLDVATFCDVSDARDKVFALFGLLTGLEAYTLKPDYSETRKTFTLILRF